MISLIGGTKTRNSTKKNEHFVAVKLNWARCSSLRCQAELRDWQTVDITD